MAFLPTHGSPRLRAIQICQISIISLTIIATLLTAVVPSKTTKFTFGLLYTLILTSISTTTILRKEMIRAQNGTLTKKVYVKYQIIKLGTALALSVVGFIGHLASSGGDDARKPGQQGVWVGGVKLNKWHGMIILMNVFNWVFLWASLFYACCMTGDKQGAIALEGEEARIGLTDETADDEAVARALQAEDPNWRQ